ncbi:MULTISPECIES: DUF5979 domain-containing protein [unclassified Microbacterium]|uniref:DUF5979 domain-containing protein n=1 Tax=unclassified Microbacterium TaxID=2609290 RepID=UPI001443DD06|nr:MULTISPECIES: DUF5979 domain-containing protein [unclassified Microbacterium]
MSKTVDNGGAVAANGEPVAYGPFEVTLECVWNEQQVQALEPMTRTIADGGTVTWTELPQGAECAVSETESADAEYTTLVVTEGGQTGEIITGNTAELEPLPDMESPDQTSVAITNVFTTGDLRIAKIVDGSGADGISRLFPVQVTCVLIDASHPDPGLVVHDSTYEIGGPSRSTAQIEGVPSGSDCVITETDTGGAAATTVTVDGQESPGASATVTIADQTTGIVFTNTFIAPLPATGSPRRCSVGLAKSSPTTLLWARSRR